MKTEHRFVYVAHPQANGKVEVTNMTLPDGIEEHRFVSVPWSYKTNTKIATGEPHSTWYVELLLSYRQK